MAPKHYLNDLPQNRPFPQFLQFKLNVCITLNKSDKKSLTTNFA